MVFEVFQRGAWCLKVFTRIFIIRGRLLDLGADGVPNGRLISRGRLIESRVEGYVTDAKKKTNANSPNGYFHGSLENIRYM